MNTRVPKELEELSAGSKRRLEEYYTKRLREEIEDDRKNSQELFLYYSMLILAETPFDFDEEKMFTYLGNWIRIKRKSFATSTYEEQIKWVRERLAKFNLPEDFIEKLVRGKV